MAKNQKMYTAQEMREAADECMCVNPKTFSYTKIYLMLRQAADDAEELAKVRARLEAVVKMLEDKERATSCSDCGHYNGYPCADHDECGLFKRHEEFTAILRAARGEGGAE